MRQPTNGGWPSIAPGEQLSSSPSGEFHLLLERITRLEDELTELKRYESLCHEKDEECAVLRQRLRQMAAGIQLADLLLPVGGVLIGLTASLFDRGHWVQGLLMLLIGTVLIGGRLWQKYRRPTD